MDVKQGLRADAEKVLRDALALLGHPGEAPALEPPPDPAMGDLGMPCFTLAKAMRKAPAAIAQEIAAKAVPSGWVARITAAGPYVNLHADRTRAAQAVLADPEGSLCAGPTGRKVLLEHTSANPNGPLHVGRARNPIVGDTLARLYRAAGHDVEVQYYMDNLGRQVATLAWGRWNLDPSTLPPAGRDKPDHDLVRYYQAAHELAKSDPAVGAKVKHLVERLEGADPDLLAKVREVYGLCFEGMRQSLERLGAHYDSVKDESDVVVDGSVARVVQQLKALPLAGIDDNGANFLDLSSLLKGQKDRFFFTRGDGTSVYATRDIAYHAWKARHVGDGDLVNVLGEDHRLQALQVGAALDAMGVKRPAVVFYAFVSLPEGKMSTRANRVVFLDDLLDEAAARAYEEVRKRRGDELGEEALRAIAEAVGIAAVRFNIARIQPEKPIEFRWEEALSFDGDAAPYLMYAHARACSLVAMAREAGLEPGRPADGAGSPALAKPGEGEVALLWAIAGVPEAVAEAVANNGPHRFCAYALRLAAAFNDYYRDHRVLECEDPAQQALRLATMDAARRALRHCLETLGLPALESM